MAGSNDPYANKKCTLYLTEPLLETIDSNVTGSGDSLSKQLRHAGAIWAGVIDVLDDRDVDLTDEDRETLATVAINEFFDGRGDEEIAELIARHRADGDLSSFCEDEDRAETIGGEV